MIINKSVLSMDRSTVYALIYVLVLCSAHWVETSDVIYIGSTSDNLCATPCLNLNDLVSNSSQFVSKNRTLILLAGRHDLTSELEITNMTSFTMTSLNTSAQVHCENSSSISISNTEIVAITSLKFLGCGENQFTNVNKLTLTNTTFMGKDDSRTALELTMTNASINNSTFLANVQGSKRNLKEQFDSVRTIFGSQGIEISDSDTWVGGVIIANQSNIVIMSSTFRNNRAKVGGALFVQNSSLTISNTVFTEHDISEGRLHTHFNTFTLGGVLYQENSHVVLNNSHFSANSALVGGSIFVFRGLIDAYNTTFCSNAATYGGTLFTAHADVVLQSRFSSNEAEYGGVLRSYSSNVTIIASLFDANNAVFGGVILSFRSNFTINGSNFSNNEAIVAGSVIVAAGSSIVYYGSLVVSENSAAEFGVNYLSECNVMFLGNALLTNNFGALLAIYSNITFSGHVVFNNNSQPRTTTTVSFQDGGALSLFQSTAIFDGVCRFESNDAEDGGAVHSVESELHVRGVMTLTNNRANGAGGGLYLSQSILECEQSGTLYIFGNVATHRGGGINAISSTVKITSANRTSIQFINNSATEGGGMSLQTNARLYVHKLEPIDSENKAVQFVENTATYGGAIYVDDNTNSATCSIRSAECFIRVVYNSYIIVAPNVATIAFADNFAHAAGSSLFGGLLDRCNVSPFAKLNIYAINAYRLNISGVSYLTNVSTGIESSSVSSLPTKVCHCIHNQPNCSYQQQIPVEIEKGQSFSVQLSAVDQIERPVNAIIQSILGFNGSGLAEGQLTRNIPSVCTELVFNIVSPQNHEVLSLFASNGPCNDAELSTLYVRINFLPCNCPIGFQPSKLNARINCTCECHDHIKDYMICDHLTETLMKRSPSNVWIDYVNTTNLSTGFLVFPNCPYGYCIVQSVSINLNKFNGADKQCALNHSGLLCGSCKTGLSLSLGSSSCAQCPTYWPVNFVFITLAALLAGVIMVVVLLVLNMTVAVGTLNGLIFYVNIVAVNSDVLLPFEKQSFITVFISWLNLELGIDACYFPGMDAYIKIWLQLGFVAAYVVFLIAFIIVVVSSYSSRFTNFIGKRNPVATLSTLVFLSYAKLLEIVFKALSFSIVHYPNGSSLKVWLPDATVAYLEGKHVILFITAILLLLLGLVYTTFLLGWQWFLCLPNWKVFKWTRNQKLHTFIETYHAPYTHKHRYWTGMLLLVRAILYFIVAINASNDPQIILVSVIFAVSLLLSFKGYVGRLYRKWPIDILETFCYFNLLTLALFAWYLINRKESYEVVAYMSIVTMFVLLVLITSFHVYKYTSIFAKITNIGHRLVTLLFHSNKKPASKENSPLPEEFLDMIERSVNTNYKQVQRDAPSEPTFSVLELNVDTAENTAISTNTTSLVTLNQPCIHPNPGK